MSGRVTRGTQEVHALSRVTPFQLSARFISRRGRISRESARNISLGSSTARGYDSRWRRLSERYRRIVPYCELHLPGCQLVAIDVDHRVPIRAGGRATWLNAQSACRSCHAVKTRSDKELYPR